MQFKSLTLQPWLYKALNANNYFELTPIQEKTFKLVNQNNNVCVSSPTGSGKTLCYLLPTLNKINVEVNNIQTIIIAPTKELVWQIYKNYIAIGKFNPKLRTVLLDDINKVKNLVKNPCHVIIGTVEKINQAIACGVNFKFLKSIVLDEADMLIDYGFVNDVNNIFNKLDLFSNDIQKIFCSASIHNTVANTFKKAVGQLISVQMEQNIFTNQKIKHSIVYSKSNNDPYETFKQLIKIINPYLCIVFANTKKEVENLYSLMLNNHMSVAMLHKDMDTRQRKQVFERLNRNEFRFLVATDLVSRGLDIDGVSDVISFGLPKEDIWYLHRSGRTGRGKYTGNSYVIYDKHYDNNINHLAKKLEWNYILIDNGKMINKKLFIKSKPKVMDIEMKKEISKLYTNKAKKVKPGYKKKLKKQVAKLQQKAKHKYIEEKFKKLRIEGYKAKNAKRR